MKPTMGLITGAAALLAALTLAVPAAAFKKSDFARLKKTKKCPKCDLSGIKIRRKSGISLYKADLRGANLEGADLQGVILWRANLEGANLKNALLLETNLRFANMQGANLEGADMRRANLRFTDLRKANLYDANLGRALMQGTKLQGANLKYVNFKRAVFKGKVNFKGAKLDFARWTNGRKCLKGSIGKCKQKKRRRAR